MKSVRITRAKGKILNENILIRSILTTMELPMKSVRITRAKGKILNENIASSFIVENKTELKNPQQGRNILGDQTNMTKPTKQTCLRNLNEVHYKALSGKKNKIVNEHIIPSINEETNHMQMAKTGSTAKRKKSLTSNSETDDKNFKEKDDKTTNDEFKIKKRPRRLDKKLNSVISNPVGVDSPYVLRVATFYGSDKVRTSSNKSSKVPIYKLQSIESSSPRICIYKTNKPEKPITDNLDRLALYEFEVDTSEEAKPKKTKKRKAATKTRTQSKVTSVCKKGKFRPRPVSHGIKKNILQPKHLTPTNSSIISPTITKSTEIIPRAVANINSIPHPIKIYDNPAQNFKNLTSPQSISALPPSTQKNEMSKSYMNNTMDAAAYSNESSSAGELSKFMPSLQDLFDEEDSQFNSMEAFTSHDNLKPIRFEYTELAQARAKGLARKSNSSVKISQEVKELDDENESQQLRQTSILNFLSGNLKQRASSGLFSTGASTENLPQLISSTPQRPDSRGQAISPLFSPVTEVVSTRSSAKIQSLTPTKQQVETEIASTPRNETSKKLPLVSLTPSRASPRKFSEAITPEKVILKSTESTSRVKPSPVKAKFEKRNTKAMPTRFSVGSLRAVLKTNMPSEVPPICLPSTLLTNEDLEQTEEPVSPKRNFHKPARKSYERRRGPKPAPNFMELEETEDNEVDAIEELRRDDDEEKATKAHHRTLHKKPKVNENEVKQFEEWISKFNSELEQVENTPLAIE